MLGENIPASPFRPPAPPAPSGGFPQGPALGLGSYGTRLHPPIDPRGPSREALREALVRAFWSTAAMHQGLGQGQEKCLGEFVILQTQAPPTLRAHPRSRELAWRREHEQELRALAGEWVIIEGDELIAHGPDPVAIVAAARARGIQVPYVFFVEPVGENFVKLGL